MAFLRFVSLFSLLCCVFYCSGFDLVHDYSGASFFDDWDFFGNWDNLTLGDVWWLNASDSFSQKLAYVNDAGHAVMKVDNTSNVPFNEKRNTVRITSKDFYSFGSLWVIDLLHIPYGCSVWPAFWTKGSLWPDDGEIDIIEAINLMPNNQMAIHTTAGCLHDPPPDQTGRSLERDCGTGSGCTVQETTPNSFNSGFAAAGGGVWATQFDVSGVYIWFWSRSNVPASISQATSSSPLDISQWGPPSGSYPAGANCNITSFFTAQQLVLDITLCGDWAGVDSIYNNTCAHTGPTGLCYPDNVVGPGSPKYDNAYFEISYVRAYTTGASGPAPTDTPSGTVGGGGSTVTRTTSPNNNPNISPLTPPVVGDTSEGSRGLLLGCSWAVTVLIMIGSMSVIFF